MRSTIQRLGSTRKPRIRSLDDLQRQIRVLADGRRSRHTLIAAVCNGESERRAAPLRDCEQRCDHVAILNVGRRNGEVDQEALRIDADVTLLAFDLLAGVVPGWIDRSPPFSALFTLWLSTIPRLAVAFRPTSSLACV